MSTVLPPAPGYVEAMRVDLPAINVDGIEVRHLEVTEEESRRTMLHAVFNKGRGQVPAGRLTQLRVDGRLWMSDSPDEKRDHSEAFYQAKRRGGRILIHGLGLGMVVGAALKLPNVEHVDVVELDERVARLIGPHYASDRCTIHVGDAYEYQFPKGSRWTVAWHDIWPSISDENWPGMNRLHRRYGGRVDWQDSWCRWEVKRMIERDKGLPW